MVPAGRQVRQDGYPKAVWDGALLRLGDHAHEIFERATPWRYFFYLQNLLVAVPTSGSGPLGVTWSLAVEELYYLQVETCLPLG
jgi:peptidoglycan/LPS O-acetylase OafA/YrhL